MRRAGDIVLSADADQCRNVDAAHVLRGQKIAGRRYAGGQRLTIALGLVGKGAEHPAACMRHHVERRRNQRVGDRVPIADPGHHADAETAEHQ
ncbi:hypothetical protein D3C86_2025250 [compost metagenome]